MLADGIALNGDSSRRPAELRGRLTSGILTLGLHLALLAAVLGGLVWQRPPIDTPPLSVVLLKPVAERALPPVPAPHMVLPHAVVVPPPLFDIRPDTSSVTVAPVAGTSQSVGTASGQSGVGTAPGNGAVESYFVDPAYLALLSRHMGKFFEYPQMACHFHQKGIVDVHFWMDRQGHVLSYDIAKSSGFPLLDAEVRTMIRQAAPLPPFPQSMRYPRLNALLSIVFTQC